MTWNGGCTKLDMGTTWPPEKREREVPTHTRSNYFSRPPAVSLFLSPHTLPMRSLWLPPNNSEPRISWNRMLGIATVLVLAAAGGVGLAEYEQLRRSRPERGDYESTRRASTRQLEGTPLTRLSLPAASTGLLSPRATQDQRVLQILGDEATVRLQHD